MFHFFILHTGHIEMDGWPGEGFCHYKKHDVGNVTITTCHVVGPERQILASVISCSGFVYEKKTLSAKSAS